MKVIYEKGDILRNKKSGDTIVVLTHQTEADKGFYGCFVTDTGIGFFTIYSEYFLNESTEYIDHDDNSIYTIEATVVSSYEKLKKEREINEK